MSDFNTLTYKDVFKNRYQLALWKEVVFPVFADVRFYDKLEKGQQIKWSYSSDPRIGSLGSGGSYSVNAKTLTDETLTVNQEPYSADRIPRSERILDHRPTQEKWARDQVNAVTWKMDADVLNQIRSGASATLDASDGFGGSAGSPITPTSSNVEQIFTNSLVKLMLNNAVKNGLNTTKVYKNFRKEDMGDRMLVAAISAELYGYMLLALGSRGQGIGDQTLRSGYLGFIYGFNVFVSNSLPMTIDYIVASGNATNGDTFTFTLGSTSVTFTLTSGSVTNPGDIKIGGSAALTAANIADSLSAPFTASSGVYEPFVASALNATQANFLNMLSASDSSATVTITIQGHGKVTVSDTAASDGFDTSTGIVHNLIGTSQSIAVAEALAPEVEISSGKILANGSSGGYLARDIVTSAYYGRKMFRHQTRFMVDVKIAYSALSAPQVAFN